MKSISFILNGEPVVVNAYPIERLLDVLRTRFSLTSIKEGCGEGECGACAVFLNGELVTSCLIPIGQVAGQRIDTLESHRYQKIKERLEKAFLVHNASQCGFCTPGMMMAALELARKIENPTRQQIKEAISGNLCRCTGYVRIVEAIFEALNKE